MVSVAGFGLLGPGLPGWEASRAVLAGQAAWQDGEVVLGPPALLPATERRRTGVTVRLALTVAAEAARGLTAGSLRTVFGSGNGDGATVCAILEELSRPDGMVSPTQFHNSVHNAAAGYWSIGAGSMRPATCLGCHDWTFAASLMKAVAECEVEGEPVLLCVYDSPLPAPLDAIRPTVNVFGMALVLNPDGPGARVALRWEAEPAQDHAPLASNLRPLAASNPAARSLRLLECLARGGSHVFDVGLLDGRLAVSVTD